VRLAKTVSAGVMAILMPFTLHHEGLKTKAYLDSGGVPTICIGETQGVKLGDVKTIKECTTMAYIKLGALSIAVDYLVKPEVSDEVLASYTDFAYNVGINAFRKSSILRLANEGNLEASCKFFPKYKYVAGMNCELTKYKPICGGIPIRRINEMNLCLSGLK